MLITKLCCLYPLQAFVAVLSYIRDIKHSCLRSGLLILHVLLVMLLPVIYIDF